MAQEFSDSPVDLFGWPVLPDRGPGRPAHVPTAESRDFVNMMFVIGHKPATVWQMLGIGKTAFYEHYKAELAQRQLAALKMKGRQLMRLNKLAETGNVAAEKALAGMIQAEQIRQASVAIVDKRKDKGEPAAKLGKKDQAKANAEQAKGRFAPRPAPSLPSLLSH